MTDWMDGQSRRRWLNEKNEQIGNALRYYMGPAAEPVNALAQGAAALSPGADMMDMYQSSGDLMNSKGGWDAAKNAGWLGASALGMALPGNVGMARKVTNLRGEKIDAPRVFYRGTNPGDERRIKTGSDEWDGHLFAADNEHAASFYGSSIEKIEASPDANILYEGTADWNRIAGKIAKNENLLQYADRAAKAAKAAGYDAAWFKRQGDVGTAIFNPAKFIRASKPE